MIAVDYDTEPAIAKLDALKERLRVSAGGCIENGANKLLSIIQNKLSGEVLNSRSGALLRSIGVEKTENPEGIGARLFSDGSVPYARIQEYGGRVNILAVAPVHAKALAFAWGGRLIFARSVAAHVVDIPERSYMRSSLDEFAPAFVDYVRGTIGDALT